MIRIPLLGTTADSTRIRADSTVSAAVGAMQRRIEQLLPPNWFGRVGVPIRNAVLGGLAVGFLFVRGLLVYTIGQTRIGTASTYWLDLIAWDFFGPRFVRRVGESDDAFRPRILAEILRPRATRAAISRALSDATGLGPDLFEPWNPGDCGAYGVGTLAYAGKPEPPSMIAGYGTPLGGYGVGGFAYVIPGPGRLGGGAGCYGSIDLPNQFFVRVHRSVGLYTQGPGAMAYGIPEAFVYGGGEPGIPMIAGYGTPLGGYGVGGFAYKVPKPPYGVQPGIGFYGSSEAAYSVTDEEINAIIAETAAAGVVPWTLIQGP